MVRTAVVLILLPLAASCSSPFSSSGGSTPYTFSITVAGPATHGNSVQVCVDYTSEKEVCGPENGGFRAGATGQIQLMANPGESYTVVVPSNQPVAPFCSVTAGTTGTFGQSTLAATVTCS